jgi:uncharacterized OsmC-like protein
MSEPELRVTMEQVEGLEFRVRFDWEEAGELLLDEPEPLGHRRGPNATRLLAAAVGNCLTASLAFCLHRSRATVQGLTTTVTGQVVRNDKNRLRVGNLDVRIQLPAGVEGAALERCLGMFEDFCTVTASIRQGIPVAVEVVDAAGTPVHNTPVG